MMHKAWSSIEEVPYCFWRSSVKFQGHTGWKIDDLNPVWVRLLGRSQLSNPSNLPCLCIFDEFFIFALMNIRACGDRLVGTSTDELSFQSFWILTGIWYFWWGWGQLGCGGWGAGALTNIDIDRGGGHSLPMYLLFGAIYWSRRPKGLSAFNLALVSDVGRLRRVLESSRSWAVYRPAFFCISH